jgi:hypothetical protein
MRRVIYCPSENELDEASRLAKYSFLPINIGDFDGSESLVFNREITQTLEIPEYNDVSYKKDVENNFHQNVNYINDFVSFNKNYKLLIDNRYYKPILVERNRIKFSFEEKEVGEKIAKIVIDDTVMKEFKYNVY